MSKLAPQPSRRSATGWRRDALWLLASAVLLWLALVLAGHLLGHQWRGSALVRWDASVDRSLAADRRDP